MAWIQVLMLVTIKASFWLCFANTSTFVGVNVTRKIQPVRMLAFFTDV